MNNAENPFEGKERLIYKWGMVLIISAFAISLTSFWFFNTFLQSNLVPSSQGNNLFFIFRLILIFFYPLAFLPGSQIDLKPIRDLDALIGNRFKFKVIKFNRRRNNIVLSRRVLLEDERKVQREDTLKSI